MAAGVIAAVIRYFFASPKEINGELANELRELRREFHAWRDTVTRHDEGMKGLSISINALTARLDRLEPYARARSNGRRD
jgi:hypothetical protein